MKHRELDAWMRRQSKISTSDLLKLFGKKNFGGPTWLDLARMLKWHGFERDNGGWTRTKPSPSAVVPTQRQIRADSEARKKRCRAALQREQTAQPVPVVYEPVNHDPEIQGPKDEN